jgi:polyphosphate:AMP phosphotransferase
MGLIRVPSFLKGRFMLDKIDLSKSIEKTEYHSQMAKLTAEMGRLQRQARELQIPFVIVFEGWSAAGKGTIINELILSMDPRGIVVHSIKPPTEEERLRPFLWQFWMILPENGRIALFDRSWYGRLLGDQLDKIIKITDATAAYNEITAFERQLIDGGAVIAKFFLHVSKKEQKKRFEKLEKNPATAWRVTKEDWKQHKRYDVFSCAVKEMMVKTSITDAPWTIVEAHDHRFASVKVFKAIVAALGRAVSAKLAAKAPPKTAAPRIPSVPNAQSVLDGSDLSLTLDQREYEDKLKTYQKRMWDLEHEIYRKRLPVGVVFEGWDAAGKGGAIKRLAQGLDPRGYVVVPFAAPNDVEKRHHYLWRFWINLPKGGHITVFDRSWYGRVLVERVEGFCSIDEWKRAYREINETEAQWTNFGMVLVKFWLHISPAEQLRRFKAREKIPDKQWKITDEDWRNREKWGLYKAAVDDMLIKTGPDSAPWTVVEATSKLYARIKVLKTVTEAIERAL